MATVLVTGGCGYIGSHVAVELLNNGHKVVIVDDLFNWDIDCIDEIQFICGRTPTFIEKNVMDMNISVLLKNYSIEHVVHCAGQKSVEESYRFPWQYYRDNTLSTEHLLLSTSDISTFIYASSASIYGNISAPPFNEECPLDVNTSPYTSSKVASECILRDYTYDELYKCKNISLRFFNPLGVENPLLDKSRYNIGSVLASLLGPAPGVKPVLNIYGNDYKTIDGTPVRDYITIWDLTKAIRMVIEKHNVFPEGYTALNLGSGVGTSVLQLLQAFNKANGFNIAHKFAPRRKGDAPSLVADITKAKELLGWEPEHSLEKACKSIAHSQMPNFHGYR